MPVAEAEAVPAEEPVRTAVEAASADSSAVAERIPVVDTAVAVAEPADNSESEPTVPDKRSAVEP